jgi:hypothetical protein
MEYFHYSEQMRNNNFSVGEDDIEKYRESLWNPAISPLRRKHILSVLGITENVKAYRLLEEYAAKEDADPQTVNWANMALMENRMILESGLLERRQVFVSTGLGGKGNRLRYFILLFADNLQPFQDYQKQIIEREFNYILDDYDSSVESITILDDQIRAYLLVPVDKDIRAVLENVITECNQYGHFIAENITITNVKAFSEEEINDITARFRDKLNSKTSH